MLTVHYSRHNNDLIGKDILESTSSKEFSHYPVLEICSELSRYTNWPSTVDAMVDCLIEAMEKTLSLFSSSEDAEWNELMTRFEIKAEVECSDQDKEVNSED